MDHLIPIYGDVISLVDFIDHSVGLDQYKCMQVGRHATRLFRIAAMLLAAVILHCTWLTYYRDPNGIRTPNRSGPMTLSSHTVVHLEDEWWSFVMNPSIVLYPHLSRAENGSMKRKS